MNNLNGGYVMIKHNATQIELAKAYESKKPVIAYDENGKGYFANIKKSGTNYFLTFNKGNICTRHVVKLEIFDTDNETSEELNFIGFVDTNSLTLENIETYAEFLTLASTEAFGDDIIFGKIGDEGTTLQLITRTSSIAMAFKELNIEIQSVVDTIL